MSDEWGFSWDAEAARRAGDLLDKYFADVTYVRVLGIVKRRRSLSAICRAMQEIFPKRLLVLPRCLLGREDIDAQTAHP